MIRNLRYLLVLPILVLLASFVLSPAFAGEKILLHVNDNGLALTPPMGWNTNNKLGCDINEAKIRAQADAMVTSGMKAVGYTYVNVDDCWAVGRDKEGTIIADPERFPSGMKALGDYIHSKGLKFGIYSDAGLATCAGRPGSLGHEYQDARTYAAWGVDYLKYDWCNIGQKDQEDRRVAFAQDARSSYTLMGDALQKSGRAIVFSMCEWGKGMPWEWGRSAGGNLWRTTGDIWDHWEGEAPAGSIGHGVLNILDRQVGLASHSGPGGWNDPDMLEVGNGGMTDAQYRAHFALWAVLAAPLIAGNDLTAMDAATREILTNREIIAVDQDALGIQASRVQAEPTKEVWARPLVNGGRAVVLLNRATTAQIVRADWTKISFPSATKLKVRDLWKHKDVGVFSNHYEVNVPAQSAVIVTVGP
jgi:alpha-galactosidase